MKDLEVKQALFKKVNRQNGEKCVFCKTKYRNFINTILTWEIVLLLVHILVFLIIFYKLIMDKQLNSVNNNLFRSINSVGHFTQGFLFVFLLVPFKFTKRITKFLINTSKKSDILENYIEEKDIEENNIEGNNIEGNNIEGNNIEGNNIEENNIEENTNENENEDKLINYMEEEKEIKLDYNKESNSIKNNESNTDKLTEYILDKNEIEKKKSSQENGVQVKKKRVYFNENIIVNDGDFAYGKKNKNTEISVCESFTNKLVFCKNISNYKKKDIQYFFLCAKLYSLNKNYFLFVTKYVTTFILMFAYPLYNLIKRKILYKYFYFSSYYINLYDFASGLSAGGSLVLIYGFLKFFISYIANRKEGETFNFYDNYAFVNDINCLCDENIELNIKNNPYLKNITMNYFSSYHNYKCLLFWGLIILSIISILSFGFSIISLNAYKLKMK